MNKEQFLSDRQQWRDYWNNFFQENPAREPTGEFSKSWRCIVTCRFEGCPMQHHSYIANISETLDGVYRVQCGRCLNAIEDLDPMLEDAEDFRLETRFPDGSNWLIGGVSDE